MKQSNIKRYLKKALVIFLLLPHLAWAWNWVGHQLVAQIAYDQLTLKEKVFWNDRIDAIRTIYPNENFIRSATLLDELKKRGITTYSTWHFINWPVFLTNTDFDKNHIDPINPHNIIWAIKRAIEIEKVDYYATAFKKGFYASVLIHLMADVHQPLHCATLYSTHFPHGDKGGNLFFIKDPQFHNLHAYWDAGAGYLNWRLVYAKKKSKNHFNALENTAKMLEKKYPRTYFGKKIQQQDPEIWARESNAMAKKYVYILPEHSVPSSAYQKKTQEITQEQIALAGYRLGEILKSLIIK